MAILYIFRIFVMLGRLFYKKKDYKSTKLNNLITLKACFLK